MSAMARVMRPLASTKGWTVKNRRWGRAALRTLLVSAGILSHSRKEAISPSTKDGCRPSKWTRSWKMAPEIT